MEGFGKQNNQLPTKSLDELKDNSILSREKERYFLVVGDGENCDDFVAAFHSVWILRLIQFVALHQVTLPNHTKCMCT